VHDHAVEALATAGGRDPPVAAVVAGTRDHEDRSAGVGGERGGGARRGGAGAFHERGPAGDRLGAALLEDADLVGREEGRGGHGGYGTRIVSRASGRVWG
jgi:hypothetical protein